MANLGRCAALRCADVDFELSPRFLKRNYDRRLLWKLGRCFSRGNGSRRHTEDTTLGRVER
jgi:hypothetical protein